jgi:hypothetical protein
MGVMACIQVFDVPQDGFQLRANVVFGLKEPHPHVMCVVIDDEHAIAEAMWGGDIHWTPKVRRLVEKGTGCFAPAIVLRGATMALWSKHESCQV